MDDDNEDELLPRLPMLEPGDRILIETREVGYVAFRNGQHERILVAVEPSIGVFADEYDCCQDADRDDQAEEMVRICRLCLEEWRAGALVSLIEDISTLTLEL